MQVVWEADTQAFANRKRAARACIACQKKKKRCNHTFTRTPDQQADLDGLDRVLPNLTHKEPIRFVGDLNPESILTDLSSTPDDGQRVSRIGTWVKQPREDQREELQVHFEAPASTNKAGEKNPINVEKYGKAEGGRRTLTAHYRNYLQAAGAFRVLPRETQDVMLSTYQACLNDLLPIIDGGRLFRQYMDGKASPFLMQAIALVTCKCPEVSQFLRLYENGPLLDPIPFARSLHTGLDAAMKADLETDRVTKIQILTLMHLHNDGPGGIEESSLHLSQAIHDAWTAGIHIHTPGRTTTDQASLLWWSIWSLDRINACIGGRPLMIADRDIDISRPPLDSGTRCAKITVWTRMGDLMDKVISFYRPTADPDVSGWEADFPAWSSILDGIDLTEFLKSHIITLELAYNIIAILSCRNASPSHPSFTRRILAANHIERLLSDEKTTPKCTPPLPIVPYAISLSLTVAYRSLRSPSDPAAAEIQKQNLLTRCEMLESLANTWWTANAMAQLGRKALSSMTNPVGVKRKEVDDLASEMDAEVAVCKYGPFEGKKAEAPGSQSVISAKDRTDGNALHLLSDAAATHSQSKTLLDRTNQHSQTATSTSTPTMAVGSARTAHTGFAPTPSSDNPPTPVSPHQLLHSDATSSTNLDQSVFSRFDEADKAYFNPNATYDFAGLDNLFDGFFDLSMPTVTFHDAVFEQDFGADWDSFDAAIDPSIGSGKLQGPGSSADGQMNNAEAVNVSGYPDMAS